MATTDPISPSGRVVVRSRLRIGVGAAVVLLLVAIAVAVLVAMLGSSGVSRTVIESDARGPDAQGGSGFPGTTDSPGDDSVDPQATGPPPTVVFVHLLGAVAVPGLYELRAGDRVVDAVAAAGGFLDGADHAAVNLARLLTDGEQIYVPRVGEVLPEAAGGGSASGGGTGGTEGKVNLNSADEAALDTLPGVGPATARSILEWRETNGRFTAVEDLLSVSGIGDKTFADLEDLVTV